MKVFVGEVRVVVGSADPLVTRRVSAHVMVDLVFVSIAWVGSHGDCVAAVEPLRLDGGRSHVPDVAAEIVVDKVPAGKHIAAADAVAARNGIVNQELVRVGFRVECGRTVGFAAGDIADADTVRIVDGGIAGKGQTFDSAAVQLQIASGKVQLVLVTLAPCVVDPGIRQGAASGDGAGAAHLHGEGGLRAIGASGAGNLALQLQSALYNQRAPVDGAGQAVNEGLHQHLRAFGYRKPRVLGDDQLRGGKADGAGDGRLGIGSLITGDGHLRFFKPMLVIEIILGDAVVGVRRGFRL